jgi:hypothetical protein
MLSSSCKEWLICQTKTKRKIERKLRVRAIQNAWNCNMYQCVPGIMCSLTQTRASGWFVLTNFLNLSQGWAKCISSIKFAGQVLWWYWWWSDICNVRSAQDSTFAGKHKETKKSNCSERCHKKEMKSERRERKRKSFSGTHRSFTHPVGIFFLLPYSLYRCLILSALSLPGYCLYAVHFEVSCMECTYVLFRSWTLQDMSKGGIFLSFAGAPLDVMRHCHNGWIYIRPFDSLNLPCTNQGYVAATFPTYVTNVRWVGIDFDTPCRWACAHVTGTESAHSTIFTHELRWCASELIRLKTMVVAENVARFQRDRRHWKGGSWESNGKWSLEVPSR